MKIAVTSQGQDVGAQVDPRFGRAKWFLVVDTDSGEVEVANNTQNLEAAQGAGIQSARNVATLGAACVLTGHCGPNAFRTLSAAGIQIYLGVKGTVAEAVEQFKAGQLKPTDNADVEGHWV